MSGWAWIFMGQVVCNFLIYRRALYWILKSTSTPLRVALWIYEFRIDYYYHFAAVDIIPQVRRYIFSRDTLFPFNSRYRVYSYNFFLPGRWMKNVLASILTWSRLHPRIRRETLRWIEGCKIRVSPLQISLRSNWLSCPANEHRQNDTRISRRVNRSHPFYVIQRRATCPTWLLVAPRLPRWTWPSSHINCKIYCNLEFRE